jgi:hypothetical protein
VWNVQDGDMKTVQFMQTNALTAEAKLQEKGTYKTTVRSTVRLLFCLKLISCFYWLFSFLVFMMFLFVDCCCIRIFFTENRLFPKHVFKAYFYDFSQYENNP